VLATSADCFVGGTHLGDLIIDGMMMMMMMMMVINGFKEVGCEDVDRLCDSG
jgi:hypothetical protein